MSTAGGMYNLTQMPGGGDGTALTLSAKVEGAESAIGDLSRLGYAYTSYELISSRVAGAEVQVERADIAIHNIELQMIDTKMKLATEEQKLAMTSANYQISLERRAALVTEVNNAEKTATGTSNQYAQAQIMLQQANADVIDNQIRLNQENMQLATTNNQLQIETNNLSVQQKILALDQQRVNDLTNVQYVMMAQLGASIIGTIPAILAFVTAIRGLAIAEAAADIAGVVTSPFGIAALAVLGIGAGVAAYEVLGGGGGGGGGGGKTFPGGTIGTTTGLAGSAQYGGIVTSPTMMLVGEAGPERISPIGSKGGGGANVNVNIGGAIIGGSSRQLAEEIGDVVNRSFDRYIRSLRG